MAVILTIFSFWTNVNALKRLNYMAFYHHLINIDGDCVCYFNINLERGVQKRHISIIFAKSKTMLICEL